VGEKVSFSMVWIWWAKNNIRFISNDLVTNEYFE